MSIEPKYVIPIGKKDVVADAKGDGDNDIADEWKASLCKKPCLLGDGRCGAAHRQNAYASPKYLPPPPPGLCKACPEKLNRKDGLAGLLWKVFGLPWGCENGMP